MATTFREWNVNQSLLFPPSVGDFVPEGHLAHFVRDTVVESLDLSATVERYPGGRGCPPYDPAMMTLLLYAYPPRQSSCRLNSSVIYGGEEVARWPDTERHSKSAQIPARTYCSCLTAALLKPIQSRHNALS